MAPERVIGRASAAAAALVLTAAAPGADPVLELSGGWVLEHFGRDITILRSSLSQPGGKAPGSVTFSCEGGARRLTVRLPGRRPEAGALLLRILPRGGAVIAPAQPEAGTYALVEEAGRDGDPVLAFARGLLDRPERLDLLVRRNGGPVALGSLTPLQVSVSWAARDGTAVRAFIAACGGVP